MTRLMIRFLVLPQLVYWTLYIFMRAVVGVDQAWSALIACSVLLPYFAWGYLTEVRRHDKDGCVS